MPPDSGPEGKLLKKTVALGMTAALLSACATTYTISPVDTGDAKVTYTNGRPTTDLELKNGAVKITPIGVQENGRLAFAVAGYNKVKEPANFGSENFTASVGGAPAKVYTYAQLEREAKNAATWAAVAVALSGAATAVAANNNAYRTTNTTMYTPRGMYTATSTTYDPTAAAVGTAAASAATAGGLIAIRKDLDNTLERLGGTILQTTTIKENEAYGGQIIVEKPKQTAPYSVEVRARWNEEDYVFRFNVAAEK